MWSKWVHRGVSGCMGNESGMGGWGASECGVSRCGVSWWGVHELGVSGSRGSE